MEPKRAIVKASSFKFKGNFYDAGIMEASSSSSLIASQSKRRRNQDNSHDAIDIDGDYDPDEVLFTEENSLDYKNNHIVGYENGWQKLLNVALESDVIDSSAYNGSKEDDKLDIPKSSHPDSSNFTYYDEDEVEGEGEGEGEDEGEGEGEGEGEDEDEDEYEDEDDEFDYDDDDHDYFPNEMNMIDHDYNYSLAATFDGLDLPPGVEATVPWLLENADEMPTKSMQEKIEDEIDRRFKSFKQFDTVQDHSDHYFNKGKACGVPEVKKPPKEWVTRIQNEWKVLEKDLPETIYVRIYEDRMDLLRAVMIGPAGTPYHDGLFFFDICFPPNYPHSPPQVHYRSGGLRINPNLYSSGKVCLSLLNTWPGTGCENWNPKKSTMLQVLVSIQALILNAKPYFNEPGYEQQANTPHGEKRSKAYNEDTFLYSCKTMLYSLRKPPKHFEDFVAGHFRERGNTILTACKAYMGGLQVASPVTEGDANETKDDESQSPFKATLTKLFEDLLMEFTVKGADSREFLAQKAKAGASKAPDAGDLKLMLDKRKNSSSPFFLDYLAN